MNVLERKMENKTKIRIFLPMFVASITKFFDPVCTPLYINLFFLVYLRWKFNIEKMLNKSRGKVFFWGVPEMFETRYPRLSVRLKLRSPIIIDVIQIRKIMFSSSYTLLINCPDVLDVIIIGKMHLWTNYRVILSILDKICNLLL